MFCHVFVDHFHVAICVLRDSSFRLVSFTLYIIDFFIEIYNLHFCFSKMNWYTKDSTMGLINVLLHYDKIIQNN